VRDEVKERVEALIAKLSPEEATV